MTFILSNHWLAGVSEVASVGVPAEVALLLVHVAVLQGEMGSNGFELVRMVQLTGVSGLGHMPWPWAEGASPRASTARSTLQRKVAILRSANFTMLRGTRLMVVLFGGVTALVSSSSSRIKTASVPASVAFCPFIAAQGLPGQVLG